MKKEDREFLKELQNEMLTQDTVCQASPRFWVVMQEVRDYWVDDNTDGIFVYSSNAAETLFEGELEELTDWIKKLDGVKDCKYDVCFVEFNYEDEEYSIGDADDLQNFLDEYDKDNYSVGYYRNREEIVQDTMFLTLRECKEHIEANRHHYNETVHPYAMTSWRSPQVKRLYEILETTNWEAEDNMESLKCELTETIARNLVAWDNSIDEIAGLLPEVYETNKRLYKQLTGFEYSSADACKRFNIVD